MTPSIAVVQKWDVEKHGISDNEEKYTSYLSTKYLLCYDSKAIEYLLDDGEYTNIELIDLAVEFAVLRSLVPCIVSHSYIYKRRQFSIKHFGIELFQKLWRDFHYKTLPRYKAVKNLQHRRLYGTLIA